MTKASAPPMFKHAPTNWRRGKHYVSFLRSAVTAALALNFAFAGVLAAPAKAADDNKPAYGLGDANAPENRDQGGGQALSGSSGDMFMEEVVSDQPKPKPKPIPIDLSRVGVSVDPHGKIVPTLTDPDAPWAGSGVKPFYNKIETGVELPYGYGMPYGGGFPMGGGGWPYPGYAPGAAPNIGLGGSMAYGLGSALGYGLGAALGRGGRFGLGGGGFGFGGGGFGYGGGGYGFPGYGYPGYGSPGSLGLGGVGLGGLIGTLGYGNYGYGPFGPGGGYGPFGSFGGGYGPFGLGGGNAYPIGFNNNTGYMTLGNSAEFISNDPVTGAPIPQGPQGNSQTNSFNSSGSFSPGFGLGLGLGAGAWLAPTTTWQQNSMWKAFNLAF